MNENIDCGSDEFTRVLYSKMPLVSCCTLTYNNFEFLYETITSILIQNYPKIEIIIADDGSANFPKNEIIQFIDKNKKKNITKFVILDHQKNKGIVKNYNSAIMASSGEYIFPVSCGDVLYTNDVIQKVINRFIATNWDLISFRRQLCDEKKLKPIRLMPTDKDILCIEKMKTSIQQFKALAGIYPFYEMASGSSVCFKKSLIESYGLFDEEYTLWEDGPFFLKYTKEKNIIHTAYDIIYIKYRYGGISTNREKNTSTNFQLKLDHAKMIKKELKPYYSMLSFYERRIVNCNLFCNEHFFWNKKILGLIVLFRWPELFFKRLCEYLNVKRNLR